MSEPLLSVVIPCFNGGHLLGQCLASLAKETVDLEILIVDDGSTDSSLVQAVGLLRISPTRVIVLSQQNQGPAAARNLGIRAASGKYLCFLDVDDQFCAGAVSAAVEMLERDTLAAAVQGRIELVNLHRAVEDWQRASMEETVPGNIIVRTSVVREMGGFPTDVAFRGRAAGEDGCFRLQIPRFGKVIKLDRPMLRYFVQPGSHVDYFLDRSVRKEDGSIAFSENSPEEKDGTLSSAFNRYVDKVTDHLIDKVTVDIQRELGGGVEFLRLHQQLAGPTVEDVDLFEAFALYSFSKRWTATGAVVTLGPAAGRSTRWLAAGCKSAGGRRLVVMDCFSNGRTAASTSPEQNALMLRTQFGEYVELIEETAGRASATWREQIRLLCIPTPPSSPNPSYDFGRWTSYMPPHSLLILHRSLHQQITAGLGNWKHSLTLQRLVVLQRTTI